jgi:hypothetical protein
MGKSPVARIKAVFYLPLHDNDGRDLGQEIDELEMELFVRFVGWTFEGFVKGTCRMADGTRSLDESGAYSVVFEEDRLDELEQVLRDFKAKTMQEAIYLEIQRFIEIRYL